MGLKHLQPHWQHFYFLENRKSTWRIFYKVFQQHNISIISTKRTRRKKSPFSPFFHFKLSTTYTVWLLKSCYIFKWGIHGNSCQKAVDRGQLYSQRLNVGTEKLSKLICWPLKYYVEWAWKTTHFPFKITTKVVFSQPTAVLSIKVYSGFIVKHCFLLK